MELVQVKMPDGTWRRVPSIVGPKGDPYTLTDADKAEIAQQAAALIPVQKIQIDYLGNKVFKMGDQDLNFADIYNYHITAPNFTFIVYGDRAYLCSFINVDDATKEMRFESVINSDNRTKVSSIYITSNDGVNIASVSTTNINNENSSNKVNEITEANEDSTDKYPSLAAIKPIREGISNKVGYSEVVNGQLLMYSDSTKEHLLATLDLPGGGVTDVEVAGASVVQDGLANIPIASNDVPGVIKTYPDGGTSAYNGLLRLSQAQQSNISARSTQFKPITPDNLVYAVDSVLCSTAANEQLTAEQQLAARQRIGVQQFELIADVTTEEDDLADVRIDKDTSGNSFSLKRVILYVYRDADEKIADALYLFLNTNEYAEFSGAPAIACFDYDSYARKSEVIYRGATGTRTSVQHYLVYRNALNGAPIYKVGLHSDGAVGGRIKAGTHIAVYGIRT